jgi:hypothetical protein
MATDNDDEFALPPAHERFAAHFTDPVYEDPAGEFAPFGTDEGADVLAEWATRRSELSQSTTLRDLLAEDFDDVDEFLVAQQDEVDVGLDAAVIGAGFTLLRLTGQIDVEGRLILAGALGRTVAFYGAQPELGQMQEDLATLPD